MKSTTKSTKSFNKIERTAIMTTKVGIVAGMAVGGHEAGKAIAGKMVEGAFSSAMPTIGLVAGASTGLVVAETADAKYRDLRGVNRLTGTGGLRQGKKTVTADELELAVASYMDAANTVLVQAADAKAAEKAAAKAEKAAKKAEAKAAKAAAKAEVAEVAEAASAK